MGPTPTFGSITHPRLEIIRNANPGCREHTNYQEPLFDPYSTDLICNIGGLESGPKTKVAKINAGDIIGFTFTTSLFHIGPLFVYMSKAPNDDIQNYDGSGDWFKLLEVGVEPNPTTGIIE